ncbi:MAG: glycoside hydrolase family 9 protein [Balneolales bacterium]|nr:glycoside hydrolase family 9 protein [Balneolales bacterium]
MSTSGQIVKKCCIEYGRYNRAFTVAAALLFLLQLLGCNKAKDEPFIAVNLVGYEAKSPKHAFAVNAEAVFFEIVRLNDSTIVFGGLVGVSRQPDTISGDRVSVIDFSGFSEPGLYFIQIDSDKRLSSHPFVIQKNVYHSAVLTMVQSYYFHRCGTSVANDSEWSYSACHLDDAPFFDEPAITKNVDGGWHDAGDYNKFSGNTALSAALLLYAYELNPDLFKDNQLDIPESGNGIPDILDETGYALKWLLKMQRPDGAVYHKVSQKKWIGEYLPHSDPSIRYIFEVSSAATASFAASAALGARLFAEFKPIYSRELYKASEKAWDFLVKNPQNKPIGGFKNPDGVSGGQYGDSSDLDERLWAAAELYKLTSKEVYLDFFIQNYDMLSLDNIPPISWRDAESLALRAFLSSYIPDRYSQDRQKIEAVVIQQADAIMDVHNQNNYRNLLSGGQYYWGSNSVGLAYAFDLLHAYEISADPTYKYAALDQLHYIMGRNPLNTSQITGIGSVSVRYPYHQLSELGGFSAPVPGMLVGGANNHLLLNSKQISPWPAKNYEDTFENYLVNEPAINFTGILVFVTSAFSISSTHQSVLLQPNKGYPSQ